MHTFLEVQDQKVHKHVLRQAKYIDSWLVIDRGEQAVKLLTSVSFRQKILSVIWFVVAKYLFLRTNVFSYASFIEVLRTVMIGLWSLHEIVCGFHDDYKTVFRDHDNNCLITLSARNVTNVEEVKAHCTLTSREWLGTLMKQVLKYNQLCYGSLKTGGRSSRSLACLLCGAECRRGVSASIVSAGGFAQVPDTKENYRLCWRLVTTLPSHRKKVLLKISGI